MPLLTATQWRAPVHSASAVSHLPTCRPCEYLPSSITSVTRARMSDQASSNEAAWVKNGTGRARSGAGPVAGPAEV